MAVLSDKNLKNYKNYLSDLKTQVNAWPSYYTDIEDSLNKSTGNQFKTEYTKGAKAAENITTIVGILKSLKSDLDKLIQDADAFYTTSLNAAKSKK